MGSLRTLRSWLFVCALLGALIVPMTGIATPLASVSADEGTPTADADGDGVPDDTDNCISIANSDQQDSDGDFAGDACDLEPYGPPTPTPTADPDGDGYNDSADNCFWVYNPDQSDADGDGAGDACDPDFVPEPTASPTPEQSVYDSDQDGIEDEQDNCPGVSNPTQERAYGYNIGVACYGLATTYTIYSVSGDTWESVPGVCYQLDEVNTGATINVCDGDGLDEASDDLVTITIPGGVYALTIIAPSGYTPESSSQQLFAIPQGVSRMDVVLYAVSDETGLEVQSLDLDGNPISGGVYRLYFGLECGVDLVSTVEAIDDGIASFMDLQPGTYCVEAQSPPAGYTVPTDTTIEEIEVYEGSTQHVYVSFPNPSVPGNTQPGTNVALNGLADGNLSVTFATVIQGGETSATIENAADWSLPPTYRAATALVYNLTTTAYFENGITTCVSFDPSQFPGASSLSLLYRSHGMWIDSGVAGDPSSGELCGITDQSGLIAIAEPASTATLTLILTDLDGNPVTGKCLAFTDGFNDYLACDGYDGTFDGQMTYETPVPAGTYELEWALGAAASDFFVPSALGHSVTIPEGESTVTETVVLTPGVRVNVSDTAGIPLRGACFALQGPGYGQGSCMETQTYYNVPNGIYTLTSFQNPNGYVRDDGSSDPIALEVQGGGPVVVNIVFRAENSQPGTDVLVEPANAPGVQITFSEITTAGNTTVDVIAIDDAPTLPAGFSVDGALFFEISTTAGFSGAITLCLPYDASAFPNPAELRLLHGENGDWVDVTTSNDGAGTICGSVTSFSPFAIAEPAISAPPLVFSGFDSPVSNSGWNTAKGGSNVPLKFSVTQGGAPQTSLSVISSVVVSSVSCSDPAVVLAGAPTDITGSLKRTGSSFHLNWKTPKAKGCYQVVITAADGTTLTALFKLT